ncbi:MAG TPA: hypothetical protein DDY91_20985 [Planctomycetaceae bacterium]|nr:hypothetical protein [Planctomycetaceae bacterium]
MRSLGLCAGMALLLAVPQVAFGGLLYDNASSLGTLSGPFGVVTNPGGGSGGADLSALVSPDTIAGFVAGTDVGRIADDFTVPAGFQWIITGGRFLGYTVNANAPTLIGATVRIWSGNPLTGGTVIFGDTTTNVQTSANWLGSTPVYRALATNPSNTQRQIQYSDSEFSITLGPGRYWIDYSLTSSTGYVYSPPLSVSGGGAVPTGNAVRYFSGSWSAMTDDDSGNPKGIPFQLYGTQIIPEPSCLLLAGLGAAGFVLLRWRKK